MACNFTSFSTVFQSYQDNGRVAGHFGPVQTPGFFFFFGYIPFHSGGLGPGCFCQILLGPFGPLLIFNNFLANETFFLNLQSISLPVVIDTFRFCELIFSCDIY